jgi:hypothetical protein
MASASNGTPMPNAQPARLRVGSGSAERCAKYLVNIGCDARLGRRRHFRFGSRRSAALLLRAPANFAAARDGACATTGSAARRHAGAIAWRLQHALGTAGAPGAPPPAGLHQWQVSSRSVASVLNPSNTIAQRPQHHTALSLQCGGVTPERGGA